MSTATTTTPEKKIRAAAYVALAEALAVVFWNKRPLETFLRRALSDAPELLAGLCFTDLKRAVADEVVERLGHDERRYRGVTLRLMREVTAMKRFANLEVQPDADHLLTAARAAVDELRQWTAEFEPAPPDTDRPAAEIGAARAEALRAGTLAKRLGELKGEFVDMLGATNPQKRGYMFEDLLNRLFALFDLEPRLKYSLDHEQIDGSLSFDTDDYIVEAKWWKEPVGRPEVSVFADKVRRKGKSALGLLIAVNGFTSDAIESYRESTPFLAVDGSDLYTVLDQRIRLDDLLRFKKRHANDTGHCFLPATHVIAR